MELGDMLAGDEAKGRGIQDDFQVDSAFHPTGPQHTRWPLEVPPLIHQLPNQNMKLRTLINYPDATFRSSSLITEICLQDTLL